jgi:superfamily II DNA or RNA helicase
VSAALAATPTGSPLRAYQTEAMELVRASMLRGHRRVVLVIPTGGGKTRIAAEIVRLTVGNGKRVVWLAHRTELVGQAARTLTELGLRVGIIAADVARDDGAPVQVASIQTLVARATVRPPADLIVWDEAHHASEAAAEWSGLLDAYPNIRVLGLTATPERGDGTGLEPIFTDLVVGTTVRKLTMAGHLVPCEVVRPDTWLKSNRRAGNPLAAEPLDAYREHARGQQGFLFASTVEEASRYAEQFSVAGIRAVCVHAQTPPDERAQALARFREGAVRVLTNCYVFTEGTDLPMATVCILARSVGTAGGFLQMVGRVLRPAPGKTSALLIDLPGVSHVHGMPEDERLYRLTGQAIALAGAACRSCGAPIDVYPCPACGFSPSLPLDLDTSGTVIVHETMQKFARKIAEGPQQREETFHRWIAAARAKGWKLRSVGFKWKGVYGTPVEAEPWWRGWPS